MGMVGGGVGPQIQVTGDIPDQVDSASVCVVVLLTDSGIQSVSPTESHRGQRGRGLRSGHPASNIKRFG